MENLALKNHFETFESHSCMLISKMKGPNKRVYLHSFLKNAPKGDL
jgi:hypothetical protein